jgi:hypothetical protein
LDDLRDVQLLLLEKLEVRIKLLQIVLGVEDGQGSGKGDGSVGGEAGLEEGHQLLDVASNLKENLVWQGGGKKELKKD